MKLKKILVLSLLFILGLAFRLQANIPLKTEFSTDSAFWVMDDFSGTNFTNSVLNTSSYVTTAEKIAMQPNGVFLSTYYANNEMTTSSCAGNSLRIRAESDNGYAKFSVPNAGRVEISLKAKGDASAPRTAKIYKNDILIATIQGLHTDSCASYMDWANTTDSVSYKVSSGCGNPILLTSISVSKYRKNDNIETIRPSFAIISDLHLMDPSLLIQDGVAFQRYLAGDRKLLKESLAITQAVIDSLIKIHPKAVLIPGDLTKDGEWVSHISLSKMLQKLVDAGIKVLVIPGNHDINNPHATAYNGEQSHRVSSISYAQFDSIYQNMGYGGALSKDSHSASYIAEPIEGIRILAIDATKSYDNNFENNTCITSGKIKAETLVWIKAQIKKALQEGKQIFAMMHHGINEHYVGQSVIFSEYLVDDYVKIGEELMNEGLQLLFSGHYHANDIVSREFNGNTLLDIQTGSTVTAPCPFRIVHVSDTSVQIKTYSIKNIDMAIPGDVSFERYSQEFLLGGLNIVASHMLPSMGIPASTPGFSTICEFIAESFAAHYAGDETINQIQSDTLKRIQELLSSAPAQTQQLFGIVGNIWNDLNPKDLNITYKLPEYTTPSPNDSTLYWIDDSFDEKNFTESVLQTSAYITEHVQIPTLPEQISLSSFYANIEKTESVCAGNSIRIRAEEDGGYAQFEVPNAKKVEIYIKAKGSASSPRMAKIYRNNELISILEGLHTDSCALFSEEIYSTTPLTYKIMSGSGNPIMLSSIRVSKNGEGVSVSKPSIRWSETTTEYLKPPFVSGVIKDETDPASLYGIDFVVKPSSAEENFSIECTSNNENVVSNKQIVSSRKDSIVNIKITPNGIGYAKIQLKIKEAKDSASYDIFYAASGQSNNINTSWHTAVADASSALAVNDSIFVVADDETNLLRMYHRFQSGLSIYEFDASSLANVSSSNPEMDIEASTRGVKYPNRLYWLASLGNSKSGSLRPNRNKVFSTDLITNSFGKPELVAANYVDSLREKIITWGDQQGWNFSASAASGMIPKRIDGFNVEGLAIAPDSITAYIGLRAPLVPASGMELSTENRSLAVIVPCKNFEEAMNSQNINALSFDNAIVFDLKGRSIRSIEQIGYKQYLIIAGMFDDNKNSAALYFWSGHRNEQPILLDSNLTANGEIHPEGIVFSQMKDKIVYAELVSDNGTADYYGDNKEAKSLTLHFRKFRKDVVLYDLCKTIEIKDTVSLTSAELPIVLHGQTYTNPGDYVIEFKTTESCDSIIYLHLNLKAGLEKENDGTNIKLFPNPASEYISFQGIQHSTLFDIEIVNLNGMTVFQQKRTSLSGININISKYPKGIYFVRLSSEKIHQIEKLIIK